MENEPAHIFDELLIIRCQDRDSEALGLLWKRWHPKILKWSFDFIKDQDIAYEIAQESWLSIFKGIGTLKEPGLFRFWAYKIVQRRSADWIRKEQRERSGIEEIKLEQGGKEVHEDKEVEDQVDIMLAAIKKLPEEHQQILRMFYLEKTPVKAMAVLLNMPEGTVKSRLHYAREQLKKKLKNVNYG